MSSITAATTSQLYAQRWPTQDSPGTRMSDTISSAVSAGTLSSTDATALTSALTSIDASLSADRSGADAASGGAGQAKLDPAAMKDRIDGLIADQVSSGSLTSDQATELKNLFGSHGRSTQSAEAGSPVAGTDGPPPGPPPSDASSAGTTGSGASTNDLLATFIQQLQSSQSSGASYGASGTSTGTGSAALLFDFRS